MKHLSLISLMATVLACSSGSSQPAATADVAQAAQSEMVSGEAAPEQKPVESSQGKPATKLTMADYFKSEGTQLAISPKAFDKLFLMEVAIQSQVSDIRKMISMSGQVVRFQRRGDTVVMTRSDRGFTTDPKFPTDFVLATFTILNSDADWVKIDFNRGMSFLMGGGQVMSVLPIRNAVINSVTVNPKKMVLEQSVQFLQDLEKKGTVLEGSRIHYSISSYRPNPNYKKVLAPADNLSGYFSTGPLLLPIFGTPVKYVTRWDITKPIRYYYSANTPKEFVQSIKDGVLYWNKAFGREVLSIEKAPKGMMSPEGDLNLIQWHDNDNRGYGYGASQHDPLTGELRRALIYVSSGWTKEKRAHHFRTYSHAATMEEAISESMKKESEYDDRIEVGGFAMSPPCHYQHAQELPGGFEITDARALEVAQDVLRTVIAHEVGHTLGLRHNFAGSTESAWSAQKTFEEFKAYLRDGKPSEVAPQASTVMDYSMPIQDALIGYAMRSGVDVLPYDRARIQWAYVQEGKRESLPEQVFCTDQWVWEFNDCTKSAWDGMNPLADNAYMLKYEMDRMPIMLAENLLHFRVELASQGDGKKWQNQYVTALGLAAVSTQSLTLLRDWIAEGSQSVHVVSPGDEMTAWLDEKSYAAGGMGALFSAIFNLDLEGMPARFTKQFEDYISSPEYGWLEEGKLIPLSQNEMAAMKKVAANVFADMPKELVKVISYRLSSNMKEVTPYRKLEARDELEDVLASWAEFVILSTTQQGEYRFDTETRYIATKVLDPKLGPVIDWEQGARDKIADTIITRWTHILGKPLKEVNPDALPRDQRQKLLEDLQIVEAL